MIKGAGFGEDAGAVRVSLGGVPCSVKEVAGDSIICMPADAAAHGHVNGTVPTVSNMSSVSPRFMGGRGVTVAHYDHISGSYESAVNWVRARLDTLPPTEQSVVATEFFAKNPAFDTYVAAYQSLLLVVPFQHVTSLSRHSPLSCLQHGDPRASIFYPVCLDDALLLVPCRRLCASVYCPQRQLGKSVRNTSLQRRPVPLPISSQPDQRVSGSRAPVLVGRMGLRGRQP